MIHSTNENGWFPVPHYLIEDVAEKRLNKSAFVLLVLLLKLENRMQKHDDWFWHKDEWLIATKLISKDTLKKARKELEQKEYLEYKTGRSHRATEYRLLIRRD